MTDIDLTPQNEESARALFAEQYADRFMSKREDLPSDEKVALRLEVIRASKDEWDAGRIDDRTVLYYRDLALASTLLTWRPTARQAWDAAVQHAVDSNVLSTLAGTALRQDNPYNEEVTP